jgi:membrane glycosyltransferase
MELHTAGRLNAAADDAHRWKCYRGLLEAGARKQRVEDRVDAAALRDIRAALADPTATEAAAASLRARVRLAHGDAARPHPPVVEDARRGVCVVSTPPIRRSPMAPRPWRLFGARRFAASRTGPAARGRWHRIASLRRVVLLLLVLAQTYLATAVMTQVLPYHGTQPLEIALLILFAILTAWISAGFWTAMAGFLLLLRGRDRYAVSMGRSPSATGTSPSAPEAMDGREGPAEAMDGREQPPGRSPSAAEAMDGRERPAGLPATSLEPGARTAVVMPICNEDVARVFAGLRTTFESVRHTGQLERFDFFVLSDSGDADIRVAERAAWLDLCRRCNAFGRVFYRLRQHRIKRKSGNIADFCRRWGSNYRYMVVLDADSVMTGACLVALVRLMEANPDAGIVQTAPRASGRDTLYARIQQFAGRVYGPLFVAGMHYWQLGESHYWGHNAIIRVAPFIDHCALARLPGRGTLSGEILSHDFVEAALMRRAGWGVWIAYDLPGSYEEMPPNLLDELKRDRRWCQGNLINSRLFFARGLHPAHRAVFVTGVMAYASAPLWFCFLVLSTIVLAVHTLTEPQYFVAPNQLFPLWPEWHPAWAIGLAEAIAVLLFLPKILAVALAAWQGARAFGGMLRLALSALLEIVFSALLAPVRMLFHARFVAAALTGWTVAWKSPPRGDNETGWDEALRRHGLHTLLGLAWAGLVWWLNPAFLWWLLPVAGALALSIPISALSSRVAWGRRARRARLFLIPEESQPPRVLRRMRRHLRQAAPYPDFIAAVVDPLANAIVCATESARTHLSEAVRAAHAALDERAIAGGPDALGAADRVALLGDAHALASLHHAVWTRPDAHPAWLSGCGAAGAQDVLSATDTQATDDSSEVAHDIAAAVRVADLGAIPLPQDLPVPERRIRR